MIKVVSGKLHGIKVTDANLNYHGSITLDPVLCNAVGMAPLEFVEIWNKASGARISTYVIYGEPNSRCCILNGAAARTCQEGDEIIIASSAYIDADEIVNIRPKVLTFDQDNMVRSHFAYVVGRSEAGDLTFSTEEIPWPQHVANGRDTPAHVQLSRLSSGLRAKGWSEIEIAQLIERSAVEPVAV